jgi:hypothetical protein
MWFDSECARRLNCCCIWIGLGLAVAGQNQGGDEAEGESAVGVSTETVKKVKKTKKQDLSQVWAPSLSRATSSALLCQLIAVGLSSPALTDRLP